MTDVAATLDLVQDHFHHPRNIGRMDPAAQDVGSALVGAPDQGGVIRLQIRVDQTGTIIDTRFKAYGCMSTIAVASWVSEWLKGKGIDEASELRSTSLVHDLSLPSVKTHCSMLAEDAVKAAVADYRKKQE